MALKNDNAQREYYLTDIVAMAVAEGVPVVATPRPSETEVLGVNSPVQLADLERRYQRARAESLMEAGVRLADPARLDVRGSLVCGSDVEIDVNCVFEGQVALGDGVRIGAHCVDARRQHRRRRGDPPLYAHRRRQRRRRRAGRPLMRACARAPNSARRCTSATSSRSRTRTLARGAKANHLAYLGDATVGERVNYGAGSITANYDGANKHRTVIGNDVHVGSNCVLVAPVTLGDGATIGGGSTIAQAAPAGPADAWRGRKQVTIAGLAAATQEPED